MKRYKMQHACHELSSMHEMEMGESQNGDYVEAAPALAWRRYALALANVRYNANAVKFAYMLEERDAAHAALVALGEMEKP